jgi:MarR family transcriptional regulator, organic hydroperoxide resistance regulator
MANSAKPGREWRHEESKRALQSMKRIMQHFRTRMDEELRPQAVTTAQLQVLFAVRKAPGSSGAQLARRCYVTPQTVQALLKHLEDGGFIVRGKDPVNDRIVTAHVTPAGERLAQSVEKIGQVMQEHLWQGISDRELKRLNDLLARCLENVGDDMSESERCNTSTSK